MAGHLLKTIKPDAKGRICLGDLTKGISSFRVFIDKHHHIILEPFTEVPAHEKWLFQNKMAMKQIKQGLKEAAEGKLTRRGKFSQYLDDESED